MSGLGQVLRSPDKRLIMALMIATVLLDAGCVLGDGISCNNADVKASIARDALKSIGEALKLPTSTEQLEAALQDYSLHDTFELSRDGDVASCRGTLGLRKGKEGLPDVPLVYQVTKSGDGNVLYGFDKERFGPNALMLIMLQGMAAKAKQDEQGVGGATSTPKAPQPAPATPKPLPYAADPNWSQWRR